MAACAQGGNVARQATVDRIEASDRIMHGQAEGGWRHQFATGEVLQQRERSAAFAMARDIDQWHGAMLLYEGFDYAKCCPREGAKPAPKHRRNLRGIRLGGFNRRPGPPCRNGEVKTCHAAVLT